MANKIKMRVTGKVIGIQEVGQLLDDARAEAVLQAEMNGNSGRSRIHLEMHPEDTIVELDEYQEAVLRTEGDPEIAMKRLYSDDGIHQQRLKRLFEALYPIIDEADSFKKEVFYGKPAAMYEILHGPTFQVPSFTCGIPTTRRIHAILGLLTEVGELLSMLSEDVFLGHGHEDIDWLKEFGDSGWYQALGVDTLKKKLSECATLNIDKLKRRYPDKFTEDLAKVHDSQ